MEGDAGCCCGAEWWGVKEVMDGEFLGGRYSYNLVRACASVTIVVNGSEAAETNAKENWLSYSSEAQCHNPSAFENLLES